MGSMPTPEFDSLEICAQNWQHELPNYDGCDKGPPSDEIWEKFGFENLTPPHSPDQDSDIASSLCGSLSRSSSPQKLESLNEIYPDLPKTLPDLKDFCSELFDDKQKSFLDCSSKLRKDCMWNGNKDSQPMAIHRRGRSDSPASLSCSPVSSGCIDPQALFNFNQISDRTRSLTNTRRPYPDSGPETPSDSEEEVDVVTVEKRSPMKYVSCTNFPSIRTKFFGSIVNQNKLTPPLTIFAADRNQVDSTKTARLIPSGPRRVSMVITNNDRGNGRKTYHLKCVPVLNTPNVLNSAGVKRKFVTPEKSPTPCQVMKITSTNSPKAIEKAVSMSSEKRRILSLDGVSMVSDTGIKRNTSKKACCFNNHSKENMDDKVFKSSKTESGNANLPIVKKSRKYTKRQTSSDDDFSTCSTPESTNQALSSSSRSTSSSGSDEDSVRQAHNVLERQRRQGLRDLYLKLRLVVPEVVDVERAPKVNILKKAREYVLELKDISEKLKREKSKLQQRKLILQQRLQKMAEEFSNVGDRNYCKNFRLF